MLQWAGWIVAISVGTLYVRAWASGHDADAHGIEALKEVESLRREVKTVWTRCGMLEGYVDTMARHVVESDLLLQLYDPVTEAARRWQEWRKEQLAQS
jgi:hypothetical protein